MSASAYNEKSRDYRYQYEREKLKRVPLDLKLSDYEELKEAATAAGMSVNGFIKQAIKAAIASGAVPSWMPGVATRGGSGGAAGGGVTPPNSRKEEKGE